MELTHIAPKPIPISRECNRPQTSRPPIHRVKTGCFTCRRRKKKCDEARPVCTGCQRNSLKCRYPPFAQAMTWRGRVNWEADTSTDGDSMLNSIETRLVHSPSRADETQYVNPEQREQSPSVQGRDPSPGPDVDGVQDPQAGVTSAPEPESDNDQRTWSPAQSSVDPEYLSPVPYRGQQPLLASLAPGNESPDYQGSQKSTHSALDAADEDDVFDMDFECDFINHDSLVEFHPMSPSDPKLQFSFVLPSILSLATDGDKSLQLLSFYLSRTANSMGNGSTYINPFISQLVPLAFANSLILDLILSQAAVHRAIEDPSQLVLANRHYYHSIRHFREAIDEYIQGGQANPLWIVLGALILCFTESARGDTKGNTFHHINGAAPLITQLISEPVAIDNGLRDFLVEYYVYTTSISVTSIDPSSGQAEFLCGYLEQEGQGLVLNNYIGHLCGCWLELILLIPRIFRLVQRVKNSSQDTGFPMTHDFVEFSSLETQILLFQPPALAEADVAHCGHIFRLALRIYLLTAFGLPKEPDAPILTSIDVSISQAFQLLDLVSPTSRINTSLCWALAVIGSCVRDKTQRDYLRTRLDIMFGTIGLGNMRTTKELLEKVWVLPEGEQGPWILWRVMRDGQMWMTLT